MNPHNIYIYNGGSYNDIHDCENVYLSCERAEVHVDKTPEESSALPDKLRTPEEKQALIAKHGEIPAALKELGINIRHN